TDSPSWKAGSTGASSRTWTTTATKSRTSTPSTPQAARLSIPTSSGSRKTAAALPGPKARTRPAAECVCPARCITPGRSLDLLLDLRGGILDPLAGALDVLSHAADRVASGQGTRQPQGQGNDRCTQGRHLAD